MNLLGSYVPRMGILYERKSWSKSRPPNTTQRSTDLTVEQQANAKATLRFLATRHGSARQLAEAMGAKVRTVRAALEVRGRVSAGLAVRVAKVAGVPLEDVLGGAWPPPGACPHCGRS